MHCTLLLVLTFYIFSGRADDALSLNTSCESTSQYFDPEIHSKFECDEALNFSKQYCYIEKDRETFECLKKKARIQDEATCTCFEQERFEEIGCLYVEYCVFVDDTFKCDENYKCEESSQGRLSCTGDGLETYEPQCNRSFLYCPKKNYFECATGPERAFEDIFEENCHTEDLEKHKVWYQIHKMHFNNSDYSYSPITPFSRDGSDASHICKRDHLWKYIVITLAVVVLLSAAGYGLWRFKRHQNIQDKVWGEIMERSNEHCKAVLGSDEPTEAPRTLIPPEICDEIHPGQCDFPSNDGEDVPDQQNENGDSKFEEIDNIDPKSQAGPNLTSFQNEAYAFVPDIPQGLDTPHFSSGSGHSPVVYMNSPTPSDTTLSPRDLNSYGNEDAVSYTFVDGYSLKNSVAQSESDQNRSITPAGSRPRNTFSSSTASTELSSYTNVRSSEGTNSDAYTDKSLGMRQIDEDDVFLNSASIKMDSDVSDIANLDNPTYVS